ncbi:hypothetical protein [Mariniflexile sp.]|uniref:hypothetical protein n=1 Tax=Mariniflexile sp. TaxID=1979402 RepID=UPI0040487948
MKEHTDKYLDGLAKKVIENVPLETPSFDFTKAIMSQVTALSTHKATVYKPLISKTGWGIIGIGFLSLVFFVLFGTPTETSAGLKTINISVLSNNKIINTLSNFKTSGFAMTKIVSYALILLGVMICIQIPFLKHHFNQRYKI